jgi:serine/threonine-protein kinase
MNDTQTMQGFIDFATDFENDIRARAVSLIVSMHLPRASGIGVALAKINDLIAPSWDQDVKIVVEPDVPVSPAVIQTLQARIADSERGIRQTAIRGLGILRAKTVTADLVRVVHEDRDDGLRFEAVRALRKIGDPSVARNLVPMLNVNSDTVRFEIISTLGSMKYRGAVSELTAIVDQPTKKPTLGQLIALAALADIADPVSLPLFERFKADKNDSIRLYANEGLARTANSGQKTDISAARLTEKNAAVRLAQSFALLRLGQTEYLDELVRGLERQSTRELAKEYLVETRPADRPALFAPRSANSTTRSGLADVMGMMGDPNALPTLQDMTRDSDTDVARAAGRAVRRLGVSASQ